MMFRVLGPLEVELGDERITLSGLRPRALLTALLLEPNTVVPAHRLVEALWGDQPRTSPPTRCTLVGRLRPARAGGRRHPHPPAGLSAGRRRGVARRAVLRVGLPRRSRLWSADPGTAASCSTRRWRCGGDRRTGSSPMASRAPRPRGWRSSGCRRSRTGRRCWCSAAPRPRPSPAPVMWHSSRCGSGRSSCSCGRCTRTAARVRRSRPSGGTGSSSPTSSASTPLPAFVSWRRASCATSSWRPSRGVRPRSRRCQRSRRCRPPRLRAPTTCPGGRARCWAGYRTCSCCASVCRLNDW